MGFFFKATPKPRRFNHVPIYWDPEADERKEREERVSNTGAYKCRIQRGAFRKYSDRLNLDERAERQHKLMVKLAIVLVGLVALALFLGVYGDNLYDLYFGSY